MTPKLQAWLSTGRISNLPTVWCNCLVLLFLFLPPRVSIGDTYLGNSGLWFLLAAATMIYIGGCFQGDAFDISFDKKHNPKRPIPSGLLAHGQVLWASIALLLAGISMTSFASSAVSAPAYDSLTRLFSKNTSIYSAAALVAVITLYSWLHKRSAWFSLSLIGCCRLALILLSATFLLTDTTTSQTTFLSFLKDQPEALIVALAVGLYTVCFASVARIEHTKKGVPWANILEVCMLALPLPFLFYFYHNAPVTNDTPWISLIAFIFYVGWIYKAFRALPTSKGVFVSHCLAGFCLLDACFLSTAGLLPVVIAMLLFVMANILQKVASAT